MTQSGRRLAKKYKCNVNELPIKPLEVAGIAYMVMLGMIGANQAQKFFVNIVTSRKNDN